MPDGDIGSVHGEQVCTPLGPGAADENPGEDRLTWLAPSTTEALPAGSPSRLYAVRLIDEFWAGRFKST